MTTPPPEVLVTVVPAGTFAALLAAVRRVEHKLDLLANRTETHMSELDDRIAELAALEDSNTASILRLITDFEGKGELNDAQRAGLDEIKQHLIDNQAAIDAADPQQPTT